MTEKSSSISPVGGVGKGLQEPEKPGVGRLGSRQVSEKRPDGAPDFNVVTSIWEKGSDLARRDFSSLTLDERETFSSYLALKMRLYRVLKGTKGEGFFARIIRSFCRIQKKSAWNEVEGFFKTEDRGFNADEKIEAIKKIESPAQRVEAYEKGAALLEKAIRRGVFSFKKDIAQHLKEVELFRRLSNEIPIAKTQPNAIQRFFSQITNSVAEWWTRRGALKGWGKILNTPQDVGQIKHQIISSIPLERPIAEAYFAEIRKRLETTTGDTTALKAFLNNLDRYSQIADELSFDPSKGIDPQWSKLVDEALALWLGFGNAKFWVTDKFKPVFQNFLESLFESPLLETKLERTEKSLKKESVEADITLTFDSGAKETVKKEDINSWAEAKHCGSEVIRQTFGRATVTINGVELGIPPPGQFSEELAKAYILSKKLFSEYMGKNPEANRDSVQKMVDELLLRETIDYSTNHGISTVCSLCEALQGFTQDAEYKFDVEKGKITCCKTDSFSFRDVKTGKEKRKKNFTLTLEMTPDAKEKTWIERMEIIPETIP